jgi:hypothetical protein
MALTVFGEVETSESRFRPNKFSRRPKSERNGIPLETVLFRNSGNSIPQPIESSLLFRRCAALPDFARENEISRE